MKNVIKWAERYNACDSATDWLESLGKSPSPKKAWYSCNDIDWLWWGIRQLDIPTKYQVAATLVCVEGVSHLDPDVKLACKLVRRWLNRKIGKEGLRQTRFSLRDKLQTTPYGTREYHTIRAAESLLNSIISGYFYSEALFDICDYFNCFEFGCPIATQCCDRIRKVIPWSMVMDRYEKSCKRLKGNSYEF